MYMHHSWHANVSMSSHHAEVSTALRRYVSQPPVDQRGDYRQIVAEML